MNPTSNPNPMPNPATPGTAGAAGAADVPGAASAAPNPVINPVVNPTVGVVNPVAAPDLGTQMAGAAPQPMTNAPVAEPVLVGQPLEGGVVNPAAQAAPAVDGGFNPTMADGSPIFESPVSSAMGDGSVFDPTAPLTAPEPVAPPDPVEEELKKPMTAVGPVPGSIGSAISMPENGAVPENGVTPEAIAAGAGIPPVGGNVQQTPSVSFSDPATEANANGTTNPMMQNNPVAPAKKKFSFNAKMDKKSLTMLCVIAGLVVVALAVVLVMMLNGML